jgi:hypothetical protein
MVLFAPDGLRESVLPKPVVEFVEISKLLGAVMSSGAVKYAAFTLKLCATEAIPTHDAKLVKLLVAEMVGGLITTKYGAILNL